MIAVRHFAAAAVILAILAPAMSLAQDYAAIVSAPDRSEADRQTDQRRQRLLLWMRAQIRKMQRTLVQQFVG